MVIDIRGLLCIEHLNYLGEVIYTEIDGVFQFDSGKLMLC